MSIVGVVETKPSSVKRDYSKLLDLVRADRLLSKKRETIIKLNLSWTLFYPACSTPPWQLDGVLSWARSKKYKKIVAVENQTVVTHPWKGAWNNRWLPVLEKHGVGFVPLTDVEWEEYEPESEMLAMHEIFPEILVPKMFIGANMVHLPTVKTHGHTTTTGAMKNAFGGLIPKYRHHAHKKIHEVLVDLLAIQKEIHPGILAVMDGTVAGDGAGPRTMVPREMNLLLASGDQVAIDAVAAWLMGFEPLEIPYIRMAHDRGLGVGDVDQIEIVGMDRKKLKRKRKRFRVGKSPVIAWDQRLRKGTMKLGPLHRLLFHSPLFKMFILASEVYHDWVWYPTIGKRRIEKFGKTRWGRLLEKYEKGPFPEYKEVKEWDPY